MNGESLLLWKECRGQPWRRDKIYDYMTLSADESSGVKPRLGITINQ